MAKNSWKEHEKIEESIKELLIEGPMSINMIKSKLNASGHKASYGLVQRRMESLSEQKEVSKLAINHQVKFWQLS